MTEMPNDKKFVFICGLHRSGTSILFQSLRDHPMISGFRNTGVYEDEGQFLQTVFQPARAYGGPGRFGFDPNSYLDEQSSVASKENSVRLFHDWARYWDLNKPVLLEKSPPNLVRTRFLQTLFPNSFFVVILRHPVAVSCAMKKWEMEDIETLLKHWIICYQVFDRDKEYLSKVHTIKYETLVNNPVAEFNRILDFLELPHHTVQTKIQSDLNAKYFQQWPPAERMKYSELETDVRNFGYSLIDLNFCESY
ncbi:sulfotransferase [bacterium]|nr:sulfotransferase [bacterium]